MNITYHKSIQENAFGVRLKETKFYLNWHKKEDGQKICNHYATIVGLFYSILSWGTKSSFYIVTVHCTKLLEGWRHTRTVVPPFCNQFELVTNNFFLVIDWVPYLASTHIFLRYNKYTNNIMILSNTNFNIRIVQNFIKFLNTKKFFEISIFEYIYFQIV